MLGKSELDSDGYIPVYSSESTNNGIIGYSSCEPEFIVDSENPLYITFGDHTRSFNIATSSFSVMDNVKVLSLKRDISLKNLLFVISSWKKQILNLGYSRHWSVAKNISIKLPTINGKIDFDFMESFIAELEAERLAELEAERLAELEAYLTATGLKDYTLTVEEQKVLNDFEKFVFKEFDVIDIFKVKNTKNILSRDIIKDSGDIPYLSASADNNGVNSYISYDEKLIDIGNCIFIGGKTFVVSYQEKDFFSNDSHNLALYLKDRSEASKTNLLYLATCINKSLGYKYSWGDSISNKKIQKDKVMIPVINDEPNYETMGTFISAIQKLVIKDVVLYAEQKIKATQQAINDN